MNRFPGEDRAKKGGSGEKDEGDVVRGGEEDLGEPVDKGLKLPFPPVINLSLINLSALCH